MKECFAFGGQGKEKREVGGVFLLYLFGPEGGEVSWRSIHDFLFPLGF